MTSLKKRKRPLAEPIGEVKEQSPTECQASIELTDPGFSASSTLFNSFTPSTLASKPEAEPVSSKRKKNHHCPFESCSKAFTRPVRLTEHIRSHTNDRCFKCPYTPCSKDFLRESHLQVHIKGSHTKIRDYKCDWHACEKAFTTATKLRVHLAAHQGRERYRCDILACGQTFRKHGTLEKHKLTVHGIEKSFSCIRLNAEGNQCEKRFTSEQQLKAHEKRIHAGNRFHCTVCSIPQNWSAPEGSQAIDSPVLSSFNSYHELQVHMRTVHPPLCAACNVACASRAALKAHIDIHHSDNVLCDRRTKVCPEPQCGRAFTSQGNLSVHFRTAHRGVRDYTCGQTDISKSKKAPGWQGEDACSRSFTTKGNLEEHVRTAHMKLPSTRKAATAEYTGQQVTKLEKRNKKQSIPILDRLTNPGPGRKRSGRLNDQHVEDLQQHAGSFETEHHNSMSPATEFTDHHVQYLIKTESENCQGSGHIEIGRHLDNGQTVCMAGRNSESSDLILAGGFFDIEQRIDPAAFEGNESWVGSRGDGLMVGLLQTAGSSWPTRATMGYHSVELPVDPALLERASVRTGS